MLEILQYSFFSHAIIGVLLTGIMTGIIGSYVVARRMVFISGGITHSSFAGLGFGFFLGQSPILYAFIAAILSGLGVEALTKDGQVREDSAIAAIWSLGMAIGVLFTFLTPGYTPGLSSFLFGNILLITEHYLWILGAFLIVLIPLVVIFYRPLLFVSFDADFARTRGIRVDLYRYSMMIAICVGIVLSIRVMGIMMLMSMLTLPQMTINLFTSRFHKLLIGSSLLSIMAVLLSLFVSFYWNLPTGAVSVFILAISFIVAKGIRVLRTKEKR